MASNTSQTYKTLSSIETQMLGQEYYRKKNYNAALEAFSAAIEHADTVPVSILDNRAATYEKVGDLPSALRDAKDMMRAEKSGPKGYLRAGKILQLMGKPEVALAIYERGLGSIPLNHPARELVHGMCRKLRLASRPTNSMDPLLFLPLELVQTILEYLAFVDLINCLGVSKGWNEYLSSMPYLWTNLDLSASKRPVRVSSIKACIRRSQRGITRATLNGLMTLQGGILKLITANCPNLEHLEICQGFVSASLLEAAPLAHSLNTLILSRQCEVTVETIMYLLGICRTISRAEFHTISEFVHHAAQWPLDLKSLRQLRLGTHNPHVCSNWRSVAYLSLDTLASRAAALSSLSLFSWSTRSRVDRLAYAKFTELFDITLQGNTLVLFPVLPLSIRALNLSHTNISGMNSLQCDEILRNVELPNLETLNVNNSNAMTPTLLERLLRGSKPGLTKLAISHVEGFYGKVLVDCLGDGLLKRLVELEVAGKDVGDDELEALVEFAPNLKRLDVSSTKVTGVGVKALVTKEGNCLRWLGLNHCSGVSLDAVEFARAADVYVEYRFHDTARTRRINT